MGSILRLENDRSPHSVEHFCTVREASSTKSAGLGRDARTLRPSLQVSRDAVTFQMLIDAKLPNFHSSFQLRNLLPPVDEVSPPPVKDGDLQPNLVSSMGHLRRNQPDGAPDTLDVFLSIKRRQDQVPNPERQVVGQLSTEQIHPITHEAFHGKMKEKLIRKLGNPSLAHPSLVMKLQNLLNLLRPVRYDNIVRKLITSKSADCPPLDAFFSRRTRYR